MKNKIDILLVNGFPPRQRVISDAALENSLAIIRTHLQGKGFGAEVLDDQRVSTTEKGVPRWCLQLLRRITKMQLKFVKTKWLTDVLVRVAWPLHAFVLHCRHKHMNKRIKQIIQHIKANNIPILGIKLWYGAAFRWTLALADEVKRCCPDVTIVVGGPQVKVYGDAVLHNSSFDLAIMGPGEDILAELISQRYQADSKEKFLYEVDRRTGSRLVKTAGFTGEANSHQKQLQNQTIPEYRGIDLQDKILFHTIVDGIGCTWNKCNFCSHTRCSSPFHPRPVEDIIKEIRSIQQYGISFFRFSSSETPVDHGKNIAEALLADNLNIRYSMFSRANKVSHETYEAFCLMIRSGLRAVFIGGETGHDAINHEVMNKGVTRKDIIETIACIKLASAEVGIPCRIGLSLIYPCPVMSGVSLEDIFQADISLIEETLPDTVIVNPPGPFPETTWFENADKFGFSFVNNFVPYFMQYEYSIYKPSELWPELGFSLQNMSSKELLKETGRLRARAASMGIPTDISDEYLMMTEAIGLRSRQDLAQFKLNSLLDIISGSTDYTQYIASKINEVGKILASK